MVDAPDAPGPLGPADPSGPAGRSGDAGAEADAGRGGIGRWIVLTVVLVVWLAANVVRLPYIVLSPGRADAVGERITVRKVPRFPPNGEIYWATVSFNQEPTAVQLLLAWLRRDADVHPREEIVGDQSRSETVREGQAEMDDAKLVAEVVAVRRLGYATQGGGVTIEATMKGTPSARALRKGDVVLEADGRSVCLRGDLRQVVRSHRVGDEVRLLVRRGGTARTIEVTTVADPDTRVPILGLTLAAAPAAPCRLPFPVSVDTGEIGGPSAGLAMTLALLDQLTPGELTGGGKVAVTGTIESDGRVGPVGGVAQKAATVRAAGASLFVVPEDEVSTARAHAGNGMRVVGVATLDEALAALQAQGGTPLPPTSTTVPTGR